MGKQNDTLNLVEGPDRVHYETGVLLNAEDFLAEQNYHRGRLARALAYVNGSGTLAGLQVMHEAAIPASEETGDGVDERIMVDPGLAIDRLGRLIEVPRALCLRLNRWYEQTVSLELREGWHDADELWTGAPSGVAVDLFIKFVACERGKTPVFSLGPFDAIDAVTAARLRDGYEVEWIIRKESNPGEPQSMWPDLGAVTEIDRPEALRNAIFDAWRETSSSTHLEGLDPLPEHAAGQDTTALFLARMVIPADEAVGTGKPIRREADAVVVRNDLRAFVITSNALARMQGINISGSTP